MTKNEIYEIKKNIDKLKSTGYTNFISPNILKKIGYKLKSNEYMIYYSYKDCDKVILYTDEIPKVRLFEIISYKSLKHSEILGSLFGLNIGNEFFGDIVIDNDKYYVYLVDSISEFVKNNLQMVGMNYVKLREVNLEVLSNYKRQYKSVEVIVSSLRIDTVISKIVGINRDRVKMKIKAKEIILNYDILTNNSCILKENDIFSIKGHGKYRFVGIVKTTKKDNYVVKYFKYI